VGETGGSPSSGNHTAPAFICCSVRIDAHTLESAVDSLLAAEPEPRGRSVHLCNAYTLSLALSDADLRRGLNEADLNLPDGMPLVWVGRRLGLEGLHGRVYGPDLMLQTMDRGRASGACHFLLGSTDDVLLGLELELERRFPGVDITGRVSPPFRPLTVDERDDLATQIELSGADIVWVGLGTPKQDLFVDEFRLRSTATFVAVGAAFDFISGTKRQAPAWMQERGLEWAYRLAQEPRRLASRYLVHNVRFLLGVARERPRIEHRR
jgi:N-acetylglucosaminyldiphosphoundecaprenol N-acetyl-beta-D-mannosaminyltransferase